MLELDPTIPAVHDDCPNPVFLAIAFAARTASALVVWVLLGRLLPSALTAHPPLSDVVT